MIKPKLKTLIALIIAILAFTYIAIFVAGQYYLKSKQAKELITSKISNKLNRKVSIGDDINFRVGWDFTPHIQVHDLVVANFSQSIQPVMLSAESLYIAFDLSDLFFKKVHITKLKLVKPILYLETRNDINNWDFSDPKDTTSSKTKFNINHVVIESGVLAYIQNNKISENITIKNLAVTIDNNDTDYHINFSGTYNKLAVDTKISAELDQEHINIDINKLNIGSSDLKGNIVINIKSKHIKGNLKSNRLSVSDIPTDPFANSNPSGEYKIPDQTIPTAFLKDSKFDLKISIKELDLGKLPLKNLNFIFANRDNLLSLTFKPAVNIPGGSLNAELSYDLKPNTPALKFNIKSSQIKLERLLNATLQKSPIQGSTLDFSATLQSQGTTLAQIVNNLNGQILATGTGGKYINSGSSITDIFTNILTAMITFDKRQSFTDLKCAVVNFKVNNGIAVANDGIALEAATVNVLGSGQVNLSNGRIKFVIKPKNTITNYNPIDIAQISMAQIINVTGTISNPRVNLDPMGIFKGAGGALLGKTLMTAIGGVPGGLAAAAQTVLEPNNNSGSGTITPCKTALGQ